jgi:hypothetical protein
MTRGRILSQVPAGYSGGSKLRNTPLIGEKAWFGPRRFGWGLDPVSPEGWAVTVIAALLSVAARRGGRATRTAAGLLLTALLIAAVLKGTAPGGPRARRAFEEARANDLG